MMDRESLCRQLVADFDRLHILVLVYADGNASVKQERDSLQETVTRGMRVLGRMEAERRTHTHGSEGKHTAEAETAV